MLLHSLTTSFFYLHMTRKDTMESTGSKRRPQLDKTNSQSGLSLVSANELQHDKTNKVACAHRGDSDQIGLLPSLIRVSTGHMKGG